MKKARDKFRLTWGNMNPITKIVPAKKKIKKVRKRKHKQRDLDE